MAYMFTLIKEAHSKSLSLGHVQTLYIESPAGRLYCAHDPHLQTAPREVRKVALSGCWDIDVENCHFSLLRQLSGLDCPIIAEYMAEKKAVRARLARDLNLPIEIVKRCLIALVYGATASVRKEDALPNALEDHGGVRKAKMLYKHPVFSSLMKEVREAGKRVIETAERANTEGKPILNAMGKTIKDTEDPAKILAHLLQGAEARMLNIMLEHYPEEILLLQHDGITTDRPLDIAKLEEVIFSETGYKITLEMEQL